MQWYELCNVNQSLIKKIIDNIVTFLKRGNYKDVRIIKFEQGTPVLIDGK